LKPQKTLNFINAVNRTIDRGFVIIRAAKRTSRGFTGIVPFAPEVIRAYISTNWLKSLVWTQTVVPTDTYRDLKTSRNSHHDT
jgi:hypothetical protein